MTDAVPVVMYVDTGFRARALQAHHDPAFLTILPALSPKPVRAHSIIVEMPLAMREGAAPDFSALEFQQWLGWLPTRLYPLSVKGAGSRITLL